MRRIVWWAAMLTFSARMASAEPLSRPLALAGITTAAIGIGMMAPYGDEYRVFDQTYCVNTIQRSIDRGTCEQPTASVITAGKWLLAVGLGMTAVGIWPKRVTVAPLIGPHITGVAGQGALVMTRIKLLKRLVAIAPQAITGITKPGPHCVMATTIGQMVLAKFGIVAHPYPVEVRVCNQAWLEWMAADCEGGREGQLRRGAYLLSNTPNFKGETFQTVKVDKPWDGHLVLRVPAGGMEWMVDLDLGSFNRPARQVHLPSGVVAPLRDGHVYGVFTHAGHQTSVGYGPLDAPYANDYQTSRDWVERDRLNDFVERLVRAVR